MNILQDLKQSDFHQKNIKGKKSSSFGKGNNYQVEIQIGTTYNQILSLLQSNSSQFKLPEDGIKSTEKLQLLQKTVQYLLNQNKKLKSAGHSNQSKPSKNTVQLDESNMITCADCQNYENNLQKLQNEVRQHIRLQQQLKIYQQSMQQKIQELKKQKITFQKKYQDLKKKYQDQKHHSSTINQQKLQKLQYQNDKLKAQNKQLKQQQLSKIKGYQSKQNKIDWIHRMTSIKKDEKQKTQTTDRLIHEGRKSMQKRGGDSTDRFSRLSTTRSTKIIQLNQKVIQQKNRQDRKRAIQSKFDYRR